MVRASVDWPARPGFGAKADFWAGSPALSGRRKWQLAENLALADIAANEVVATDGYGDVQALPEGRAYSSPVGFVLWCLGAWQMARNKGRAPWRKLIELPDSGTDARAAVDALAQSGLFECAKPAEGRLFPLPGDVVIGHDGHVAIAVTPLCAGCRTFEVVEMTSKAALDLGVPLTVRRAKAWISNVALVLRAVPERATEGEPQMDADERGWDASDGEGGDASGDGTGGIGGKGEGESGGDASEDGECGDASEGSDLVDGSDGTEVKE